MQPTPFRLSQALWTAFRAAKPSHKQLPFQHTRLITNHLVTSQWSRRTPSSRLTGAFSRSYSDNHKSLEVEKQAEEAKKRIDQSLDSRADIAQDAEPTLKTSKDETIVHTLPEASSIVHPREPSPDTSQEPRPPQNDSQNPDSKSGPASGSKYTEWASTQWQNSPLPSQIASLRSRANKSFTTFMDNLQSNIVIAAHHLNDLTGYSGIERLKKEIEVQESAVQAARKNVKESREKYSQAIAMRSDTQREVNDLLHRKHAWSPTDLERFTHLYRSDHANEQAEQKTHQTLSQAEAQYEEESTRLAKSILARYHEEQIWSDKIRQMSTWGTWGLMGLNVLLFIVFQILIEPWRRRRLVKGFEEKVQAALDEKERATDEKFAIITARKDGDQVIQEAVQKQPEGLVATAAEEAAELIADAVTGASSEETTETPSIVDIEKAAEQVTQKELEDESQTATTLPSDAPETRSMSATTTPESLTSQTETDQDSNQPASSLPIETLEPERLQLPETWQNQLEATLNSSVDHAKKAYTQSHKAVIQLFNEKEHVVLSKRDLTTKVLEGVAAGVAITCGIMFVVVRGR